MIIDINSYYNSCHTCKISKPNNQKLFGLLHPLSVPNRLWEGIGIDFVGPFPESKNLFENVYKLYGLPNYIVSNCDSLFTSMFWRRLHELISIKLKLLSTYHPQTNGLTERMNRTITQMLRQCISPKQKDWIHKLLMIKYAINTVRSETIGYVPFFLNYGQMPRNLI
ncbi:ribonuclease H-like protein [Fomitiporia mediterranea MF3/22]|uniref:Ribonuclease H-like protein n=1 Tax=Fomitiporia mediterranea (strain MF3/22) TaxID=694068 RepID=R7SG09_FOMME|nr:ribonuclease H-like protein [Fomitiporia mediterranea MF3/22]EJC97345.1 ribonuclease H-like protein [Fomitiporia mediterranea MF3/22]